MRCEAGHPVSVDLSLERVQLVKSRLGLAFRAPVITVGGTNGKGSVCAMLESIATHSGWRVGCYSKPHLISFEERCRINGVPTTADQLIPHFAAVEKARGETTLTYFEHTTLAILRFLSTIDLDLVVLEVGLGGRRDAVNVVDADCSVITTVDIDHTEYLGPTREVIGLEKAGIMRPNRPVVVGDTNPPESLCQYADLTRARLLLAGRDFHHRPKGSGNWMWSFGEVQLDDLPNPALVGDHQGCNAAVALTALASLSQLPELSRRAVASGLSETRLRGRFQILRGAPAVILDVAHNRQAACALSANLSKMRPKGRVLAVFGCMRDKDVNALIESILVWANEWFLTDLPVKRAATAHELSEVLRSQLRRDSTSISCWARPMHAFDAALTSARPDDLVLVFGSFYTVGEVLAHVDKRIRHGRDFSVCSEVEALKSVLTLDRCESDNLPKA